MGGECRIYFPAGEEVPGIAANDNREGYYLLTTSEMKAVVNP